MNDMVTIPREEYERLKEAAEDLSALQAYDRAIAEGGEAIPSEAVKRMLNGEKPLRVFRELRGHTQTALACLSGVNRVQIADIETGRSRGSIDTMRRLADALAVTIDDLI